jgi:hypothetical protein
MIPFGDLWQAMLRNIIPAQNNSIKPNFKPRFFLQRNKPCRSLAVSQKRVSLLFFVAPQIIYYHPE